MLSPRPPPTYHAGVGLKERGDRFLRLARQAIADLFDQKRPFGRLALTHVLMTAGDTLFAVSLAGSLFFSISPTAAKDKVLLYLLLTMGPFAVVAPGLGPLVDRSRGARRAMVVASAVGRAALCPFLARDIHSLLLFPEAFLMLVLSKVYLVTKGALVPEIAALEVAEGPRATEGVTSVGEPDRFDPTGRLPDDTPPYGTPMIHVDDPVTGEERIEPDLATMNARLGLLASLAGFVFALPALGILKLAGAPGVLWADLFVFVAAVAAGLRLPVRRDRSLNRRQLRRARAMPVAGAEGIADEAAGPDGEAGSGADRWEGDAEDLALFRPLADPEAMRALGPMSVLKGVLGFLTFLLAFGFRREDAATWWFGLVVGALTAGALVGVLVVSRLRRYLSEPQMLLVSLALVFAVTLAGGLYPPRAFLAVVSFGVGAAGAMAKPSFDALVQQHVQELDRGRAFARFETRLQLMWVLGALVPVVLSLPIPAGNAVMAACAGVGGLLYFRAERRSREPTTLRRQNRR